MAFESVNVGSLRTSLQSLKSSLTISAEQAILDSFSNSQNFTTTAIEPMKEALSKLIQTRYKELEELLQSYLGIADLIESYKNKEEAIKRKEEEISREQDKEHPSSSKISRLRREIRTLRKEMEDIVSNVDEKLYQV